jgi:hypothetical protein
VRRLLWCVLAVFPSVLLAQGDCFPPEDSHEAQMFGIFAVPLAFGPAESPARMTEWTARFAVETSYIPNVSDEIATPTICRPGKGPENTDFATLLPRPRLIVGMPSNMVLEASWVPPVSVNDATPNLLGFSLGKLFALGRRSMLVGVRLHATTGIIRAPITCDDEAVQDPVSECFNADPSNDKYQPNAFGADVSVGWSLGGGRVQPFVGTGVNLLRPRFRVNFTNQFGQLDNRRVEVDLERLALFAGATWHPMPRLGITGQIYSAPADAVTGRLTISYGS